MGRRIELQHFLEELIGSTNVYFQPPPSVAMEYPAIVYELSKIKSKHADNKVYAAGRRYSLTYITRDADDGMVDIISELDTCAFDRQYTKDNLYHFVFRIYY